MLNVWLRTVPNQVAQWLNRPRAIALFRVLCAAFLFLMACSDGSQERILFEPEFDDIFALGYLVLALCLCLVATSSWWWDFRLGAWAVTADIATFVLLPAFLEPVAIGYFAAAVMLATLIITSVRFRFGRITSWIVAALVNLLCFSVCGFAHEALMTITGHHLEPLGVLTSLIRTIYLMLVSLVLLGMLELRNPPSIAPFSIDSDERPSAAITALAGFGRTVLGVQDIHLCWYVDSTRTCTVGSCRDGSVRESAVPCQDAAPTRGRETYLFDTASDRHLLLEAQGRLRAGHRRASSDRFVQNLGIASGAVSNLNVNGRPGRLLATLPTSAGWDFLEKFEAFCVAVEISLERYEHARSVLESELSLERQSLSRDLHDNVAQSLAATRLWLESLRLELPPESPAATKITNLKALLDQELDQVRTIMRKLNDGPASGESDQAMDLEASLHNLKHLWRVDIASNLSDNLEQFDQSTAENMEMMLREAVSNAVRHGGATSIEVDLSRVGSQVFLSISDNGTPSGPLQRPQNLASRVQAIGGTLEMSRVNGQTLCMIGLPAA